jgi:hypothetical protein
MTEFQRRTIIWVVTVIWVLNVAVSMVSAIGVVPNLHYNPDPEINGIFLVVVGSLFALKHNRDPAKHRKPKGDDTNDL